MTFARGSPNSLRYREAMRHMRTALVAALVALFSAVLLSGCQSGTCDPATQHKPLPFPPPDPIFRGVKIEPPTPSAGEVLTCTPDIDAPFDLVWYVNSCKTKQVSSAKSSTFNTSQYLPGDVVRCEAWVPGTDMYYGFAQVVLR